VGTLRTAVGGVGAGVRRLPAGRPVPRDAAVATTEPMREHENHMEDLGSARSLTPGGGPIRQASSARRKLRARHPILLLIATRSAVGLATLWAVSVIVFAATQALPGNTATAVLGQTATPQRLAALEHQLHLDRPVIEQYTTWFGGVLRGDLGRSLVNGQSVAALIGPRIQDSAVLVLLASVIATCIAVGLGMVAAARRDRAFDHVSSSVALAVTALPEFVIAIALVMLFAGLVWNVLPAVSAIPPGVSPWSDASALILPTATLVIVVIPYMFRIVRAAMIEALESDYVEMARLKGLSSSRILLMHALPNALPPIAQVFGLSLLYLSGGIVVVEYVFNYPGVGSAFVSAMSSRDVPMIQFIVLALAGFYVVVNIATDVVALVASPRRRVGR
jgi:peptide/nickel transport system permease protein